MEHGRKKESLAMHKPSGLVPSVVLAGFLGVGFAALWGVLLKWGHETVRSFRPPAVEEALLIRADGTPVVERFGFVRGKSIVPPEARFRDLAGNRVEVPNDARWAPGVVLFRGSPDDGLLAGLPSPAEAWEHRLVQFPGPGAVTWYFITDGRRHGSAYFVAYDTQEAERVGYLGTAGFRATPLPAEERFPFDGSDRGARFRILHFRPYGRFLPLDALARQPRTAAPVPIYVHADSDTIYEVELGARAVRVAFAGQPVRSAGVMTRHAPGPDAGRTFLVVCTDDEVLMLDGPNRVVRRFPLPEGLRDWGFTWLETSSGE